MKNVNTNEVSCAFSLSSECNASSLLGGSQLVKVSIYK